MIFSTGWLLEQVFKLFKVEISLKEAIFAWLLSITFGVFTAGIGGPAIIFLRARKNKSTKFGAIVAISFFILYFIPILLLTLFIGFISIMRGIIFTESKIIDILIILILIGFLFYFLRELKIHNKLKAILLNFFSKLFEKDKKVTRAKLSTKKITRILLISSLVLFCNLLVFIFILLAFKFHYQFLLIIKNFVVFEMLSIFSPSTGGLGFADLGLTGSLILSGFSDHQAATTVFAFRLINFWLPFVLGGFVFIFFGRKWLREGTQKKIE